MHSKVYYDLVERRAVDFAVAGDANGGAATASAVQSPVRSGNPTVLTFMGLRVIVSDDVTTAGSGEPQPSTTFFFTQGAVASGEQLALQTETDRDILAKSDAMSIDLHYCYHPVGSKPSTSVTNPTRSQLETVGNWTKVYETKNLGIVRATNVSNMD